jgi:integrase
MLGWPNEMNDLAIATGAGLDAVKALALDAVSSPHSRRAYGKALDVFLVWFASSGQNAFTKAAVQAYRAGLERRHLSPSTINVHLAAIRKLAREAADNGLLPQETAAAVERVRGIPRRGVRVGNWLSREQAQQLLEAPDPGTSRGKRDRALLALLAGCGLRRQEAATLRFGQIRQRDGRWVILDLAGKHGRVRTVPMPGWAKDAVDAWAAAAGICDGAVLRAINKGGRIGGESMTPQAIFTVVSRYGASIGVELAPHDLRRTFAKLAYAGSAALEQIQLSLGHASIQTTERYLGVCQDLSHAPCDHLGVAPRWG